MSEKVNKKVIQELRELTGLGLTDCKNALEESHGDVQKALEILRKKGAAVAGKRSGKATAEGIVEAYIHPGSQIGVLIEMNCETDFVARTPLFKQLAQDLCMHIAAMKPLYIAPDDVDQKFLEHEKEIARAQLADSNKPPKIIDQILEGKISKLYTDVCLLKQQFIKNDSLTVEQVILELVAKTGENIKVRRFSRFEVGV